jgi:starch synthase (maltosyl-transferring)
MGHALPMDLKQEMIRRARAIDPDFAFWDENFSITPKSVEEGYNAVIGYQWSDQHHPEKYRNMLRRFSGEGYALPYFATAESHNTPRAAAREGGLTYSRYSWALSNLVPAIPFIHSGFEIGETYPINTGLDFTHEDLKKLPSEKLPLFSEYAYDWLRAENCLDWICAVSEIRAEYHDLITNRDASSFRWIEDGQPDVIAFVRLSAPDTPVLLVVANSSMKEKREASIPAETHHVKLNDLLGSGSVRVEHHRAHCTLAPGQVMVFEL